MNNIMSTSAKIIQTEEDIIDNTPLAYNENFVRADDMTAMENSVFGDVDETLPYYLPLQTTPAGKLLQKYCRSVGLNSLHLSVFDKWFSSNNPTIVNSIYPNTLVLANKGLYVTFSNLRYRTIEHEYDGKTYPLTSKMAQEKGMTYGKDLYLDFEMREGSPTGKVIKEYKDIHIARMPIMLLSKTCMMHGLSPEQLEMFGQDRNDKGGNFINGGFEKIVLAQEQLALQRLFLMVMSSSEPAVARMTVSTYRGTSLIELILNKNKILKLRLPSLSQKQDERKKNKSKSLNILRIFRIFGIHSEDQIKGTISLFIDPSQRKKCMLELSDNFSDYFVNNDDYRLIAKKLGKLDLNPNEQRIKSMEVLNKDLFPHMNDLPAMEDETVDEKTTRLQTLKLYMLSIMIARYLEYLAGFRDLDDRDSWSNKRIESAGRMMEALFRNAFRKCLKDIQSKINDGTINDGNGIASKLSGNIITDTFFDSFNTSFWGVKNYPPKTAVSQTLSRDNMPAAFAHINTIDVSVSRTDKQPSLRLVQNSQYGFICAVSTPEGKNCGILKNLCLTTTVSLDRNDHIIIRDLFGDSYIDKAFRIYRRMLAQGEAPINNILELFVRTEGAVYQEMVPYFQMHTDTDIEKVNVCINTLVEQINNAQAEREVAKQWVSYDPYIQNIWSDKLIVNGKFLGWCEGDKLKKHLISQRRHGDIFPDTSIIKDGSWLYVEVSPSRLIRPLLIVDEETQELVIDKLGMRESPIPDLFINGVMEYISPWEQEFLKIAEEPSDIKARLDLIKDVTKRYNQDKNIYEAVARGEIINTIYDGQERPITLEEALSTFNDTEEEYKDLDNIQPFTHCEIHPLATISLVAGLIVWPNHNQAPRNLYQVSMSKQAVSIYHSNHLNRMDGKTKVLCFPQRPIVETDIYTLIGLDINGPGQNIKIAFLSGYANEEDSFMVKKQFLDNGGFRSIKYLTYKTSIKMQGGDFYEVLDKPPVKPHEEKQYAYIQTGINKGLPMIGAYLKQGSCVIGKFQKLKINNENKLVNASILLRVGDEGIVEKVQVENNGTVTNVIVKLRIMRIPQAGDKFAPRNAQKGTIGIVEDESNLPFSKTGLVADFFMNPSCIPSRMTIGYLLELFGCKHGSMRAAQVNANVATPPNIGEYRETMKEYGMHEFAYEELRSGTTGHKLESIIYMGPCFVQSLKHHVLDKIQGRGRGQKKPKTRQPVNGRGILGGLRFGEMERDSVISHGATSLLRERLMFTSDAYRPVFCKDCGSFAENDWATSTYYCPLYRNEHTTFGPCTIPYAYKLLVHLLGGAGINLRAIFETTEDHLNNLSTKIHIDHMDIDPTQVEIELAESADFDQHEEEQNDEYENMYKEDTNN